MLIKIYNIIKVYSRKYEEIFCAFLFQKHAKTSYLYYIKNNKIKNLQ